MRNHWIKIEPWKERSELMFHLFYHCGFTYSELAGLKIEELKLLAARIKRD